MYGYYGAIGRRRFRFYSKGMVIAGFHGTVGKLFHSFGVYIKPLAELGNGRPEKVRLLGFTFIFLLFQNITNSRYRNSTNFTF